MLFRSLDTATHADYVRLSVLVDGKFAIEDVIAELEHVTEADIEAHRTHALSDAHLEALIAGNMTASETRDLARCETFPVSKTCIYISYKCKYIYRCVSITRNCRESQNCPGF